MARPKKAKTFAPPSWQQAIRAKFLNYAVAHNSPALRLLATEVRDGHMTVRQWVVALGVAGTWIEQWAENAIEYWRTNPPTFRGNGEVEMWFPAPRDGQTAADVFTYSVTDTPRSRASLGVTMGGSLKWYTQRPGDPEPVAQHDPLNDWEQFKKEQHAMLEDALNRYQENAVHSGASDRIAIPAELDRKLEIAALYVFCGMSPERIWNRGRNGIHADRTTINRWLKEVMPLLDLKMRRPGRKKASPATTLSH